MATVGTSVSVSNDQSRRSKNVINMERTLSGWICLKEEVPQSHGHVHTDAVFHTPNNFGSG